MVRILGEVCACCDRPVFGAGGIDIFKYSKCGLYISTARVVLEIRATKKTVANGVVQNVCTVVPV